MKKHQTDVLWNSASLFAVMEFNNTISLTDHPERPGGISVNNDEFTAFARHWLDLQGYDVIKREPELLPCPNPECGRECKIFDSLDDIWVQCNYCYYRSPEARTVKEAVRLHNQMPRIKR